MKRDLELIRKLLVYFDEKPGPEIVKDLSVEGYDRPTVQYHLVLLFDAGFLRAEPVKSSTSDRVVYVLPCELTWEGHEFLSKIRNEFIWDEVRETIRQQGLFSASVDVIKRLADVAVRKRLKLPE